MRGRRRATAIGQVSPLNDALRLVHQNLPCRPRDCLSRVLAVAPAQIARGQNARAGWLVLDVDQCKAAWLSGSLFYARVTFGLMPNSPQRVPSHWEGGARMSGILISLIIQAIGGAIGRFPIGAALKNLNLGPLGNTLAGAIGGAGGGFDPQLAYSRARRRCGRSRHCRHRRPACRRRCHGRHRHGNRGRSYECYEEIGRKQTQAKLNHKFFLFF